MPLDPRAKRFLDMLAAANPPSALSLTVPERRRALEHLLSFSGVQAPVGTVRNFSCPADGHTIALRSYIPEDAPSGRLRPALMYFHGGGLVAGGLDSHDAICRALCHAAALQLISVDYRLGPEHPFPAAIEDGLAACRWVASHANELNIDRNALGICGDSAGATLAAVIAQALTQDADVRLAFQFLLCPITDFAGETESRRVLSEGYLVDSATLQHDLKYYLAGGADAADPRVSPLRASDLHALPPAIVHTAEFDPLRDEGCAYADRLAAAGVRTTYRCHPDMIHLFYGMGGLLPYASKAYTLMGEDIRALLDASDLTRGSLNVGSRTG
jgi:acetyl esterase/lipase